jgi:hypothetical protein
MPQDRSVGRARRRVAAAVGNRRDCGGGGGRSGWLVVNGGPGSYSMPSSMLRLVLKSRVPPVCPQGLAREQRFCSFGTKFIEIARGALSNCVLKHFPATVQPGDLGPPTENAVIRRMTGSQGRDCTETTIWARSQAALEV